MAKIKDIGMLREHALNTLEQLAAGEIDVAQASATGKLCDGIISTIKTQLEYSRMIQEDPDITFMKVKGGNLLEGKTEKSLPHLYEK